MMAATPVEPVGAGDCNTEWRYEPSVGFQIDGNVIVTFKVSCNAIPGAAQSLSPTLLPSVRVQLLLNNDVIAEGYDLLDTLPVYICEPGGTDATAMVELDLEGDPDVVFTTNDDLRIKVQVRAINTEEDISPYWYVKTDADSEVSFNSTELPPEPECSDSTDNDGDGQIDFPADLGCDDAEDDDENDTVDPPACSDNLDNDGDEKIDFGTETSNDPGCTSAEDDDETDGGDLPQCSDGLDNDGDADTDHPDDPGCVGPEDDDETDGGGGGGDPECSDGVDNDGDTNTDHPADPGCTSPTDDDESDGGTTPAEDDPRCDRDDPAEGEITRNMDEAFTLMAVCTDPDDDLATGEWTVDDEPIGQEDLGPSPDEVDEEFVFEEPGTHIIEFTPTDEEGNVGTPASWVVHVSDGSGEGDAPTCARDEPTTFEVTQPAGEPFTLQATCTDPDDDLDHGTWIVDDEEKSEDELGDSPATAEEEFEFDECGTYHIHVVPTDEAGNTGASATWRVTITDCDGGTTNPTPTTPIPVFPSTIAMILGVVGAMGGGFLILRRRVA